MVLELSTMLQVGSSLKALQTAARKQRTAPGSGSTGGRGLGAPGADQGAAEPKEALRAPLHQQMELRRAAPMLKLEVGRSLQTGLAGSIFQCAGVVASA